jgi:hypothetical protein
MSSALSAELARALVSSRSGAALPDRHTRHLVARRRQRNAQQLAYRVRLKRLATS